MRISVVIPSYQGEKVIGRAVSSVMNQVVGADVETIVVDDCSADRSAEIARAAGARVYSTKANTGGPNKGRNIGIEKAIGDYVCLLDQDDEWMPEKLQRQIEAAEYAPIVHTGFWIKHEQTNIMDLIGQNHGNIETFAPNEVFLRALSWTKRPYANLVPSVSSIMFRRSIAERFEERFGLSDFDWLLRMLENRQVARIGQPLYIRHVDDRNLSLDPYYRRANYCLCWFALEGYAEKYPREAAKGMAGLEGTRARYFYRIGNMKKARMHLRRSKLGWKTLAYYLTSYAGSGFVRRHFRVFGT